MSCCAPYFDAESTAVDRGNADDEVRLASRRDGNGLWHTDFSVPTIHCGGCIPKIEKTLARLPGGGLGRVNLSTRRVAVRWTGDTPPPFVESLAAIGYEAHLHDMAAEAGDPLLA